MIRIDPENNYANGTNITAVLQELAGNGTTDGVNPAPIGSRIIIDRAGYDYVTTSQINIKRPVTIEMGYNTRIRADFTALGDIFAVDILDAHKGNADHPRGMTLFKNVNAYFNNTGVFTGRNVIAINRGMAASKALTGVRIVDGGSMAGFFKADGSVYNPAVYMTGYVSNAITGPTHCYIQNASLEGGVHLDGVADGIVIENNQIFGFGKGVKLNIVAGGFFTRAINNCITSSEGALDIIDGSDILFQGNHDEQGNSAVATAGQGLAGLTAQFIVRGTTRQARRIRILNNNFGQGIGLVGTGFALANCTDAIVEYNTFGQGTQAFDGRLTATAPDNFIGKNFVRGARGAGYPALIDRKFVVQDLNGTNSGVWHTNADGSNGTFSNGWTGASYAFKKVSDGLVLVEGAVISGGAISASIKALTMPAGFRPSMYTVLLGSSPQGAVTIQVLPTGECYFTVPAGFPSTGGVVYMPSFKAMEYTVQPAVDGF